MKRTILYVILFLGCNGILSAQEKSANTIDELTTRLENIGTVAGSISEYFTSEELVILQNHFKNNREGVEKDFISEKSSNLVTKAYTTSATVFGSFEPPSGEVTVISSNSGFINAGVMNPNDPAKAYVFNNTGNFFSIDVATGVYTLLGNISGGWLGAEVNPVNGIMYAIADDMNLYSIDTIAVTATLIGNTGVELLIALAIDGSGNAYSYSLLDDNLYGIDLTTGASTLIGPIGFDANFGQGMFWHTETDTIYMAAFNNTLFDAELRSVNTTTGETTFISTLGTGGTLEQFAWASSESVAPGPDPQVYNTWYLSEMTIDLGESTFVADIFPPISPTMIVNQDLSFTGESACNAYMGDFIHYEEGDFFTIHNFDATLNLCDYDSHNDFETDFYTYFGVNADVLYNVGGTGDEQYFVLEFAPGYELIFQNVPVELSVNENDLATFKLYPNPASDQLFITSENYVIETVTIYSALGRKILELEYVEDSVDVSHLSEGLYFIEVSTSEGKSVQKFIKK